MQDRVIFRSQLESFFVGFDALGEILVEELSLGLDPYPRKAGVEFAAEQDTVAKADHPFAVLSKLQGKGAKKKGKS